MPKRVKPGKHVKIELTEEQKRKIAEVFGEEFAQRIADVRVDQIEGYLLANVVVN
jgi:hypothetical protein